MWNSARLTGGLREITTKAICAKGQKRFHQTESVTPAHPGEHALGSRVTGHAFQANALRNSVEVKGMYDVHLWYTYADGSLTAVEKKTVRYTEYIPVIDMEGERLGNDETVATTLLREPEVVGMSIKRGAIQVSVDLEFYVEIVGETKLWVKVYDPPFADDKKDKAYELDADEDYFDEDELAADEYDEDFDEEEFPF